MNKLSTNPVAALPACHNQSEGQLEDIKRRGAAQARETTHRMVLERLKRMAIQEELEYNVSTLKQLQAVHNRDERDREWKSPKAERRKERKTNSVNTDFSSLSMNTTVGGLAGGEPKYSPCPDCGIFHDYKRGCIFWDPVKRVFKLKAFLDWRTVTEVKADGTSVLSEFWMRKLKMFGFRAMGITEEKDQAKIIQQLRDELKGRPLATVEERRAYAAKNRRTNLALQVEGAGREEVNSLQAKVVALTNKLQSLEGESRSGRSRSRDRTKGKQKKPKTLSKPKNEPKGLGRNWGDESDSDSNSSGSNSGDSNSDQGRYGDSN